MGKKRLYRTEGPYKMLCGVCGGLAEYFDVDPTLVRVGWVIASFVTFSVGFWAYVACAIIMPTKSTIIRAIKQQAPAGSGGRLSYGRFGPTGKEVE